MPTLHYSTRRRCEVAFKSYVETHKPTGGSLDAASVDMRIGQTDEELVMPVVIFSAQTATAPYPPSSIECVVLEVLCQGVAEPVQVTNPADVQEQVAGEVARVLFDVQAVLAWINGSNGQAAVDGSFKVFGYHLVEQFGQVVERHWMDTLKYEVYCTAVDKD